MSEFNNRISAQRTALKVINRLQRLEEPLFSLSEKAINRWVSNNKIDPNENMVLSIRELSKKLFFLANKSQEQITEDYKKLSNEVFSIIESIENEIDEQGSQQESH